MKFGKFNEFVFILLLCACEVVYAKNNVQLNVTRSTADKWTLINRTLLSVGDEVFTAKDLAAIGEIAKFKGLAFRLTPRQWYSLQKMPIKKFTSLEKNVASWTFDVHQVLFVLLAAAESKKLNLFSGSKTQAEKDLTSLRKQWNSRDENLLKFDDVKILDFLQRVNVSIQYNNFKGDLFKNPKLLDQAWYWHDVIEK